MFRRVFPGCGARLPVALMLLSCGAPVASAAAQPPVAIEANLLAAGWGALARGDATAAARIATELSQDPGARPSLAALAFVIEAAIVGADSQAGLAAYERWLGNRAVEAPYALRRIARGLLREASVLPDGQAALQALAALARDGDGAAAAELASRQTRGDLGAAFAAAASGDAGAVDILAKRLTTEPAGQERLIDVLAESGSERAIPAIRGMLTNPRDSVKAAAARALGRLSAREDIPALRALLEHHYPAVRVAAAEALYRMDDDSGRQVLETFAASEYPGVRIGAADAMASRPDAAWKSLVMGLMRDGDPAIRVQAARLLAPHDPQAAAETLAALMEDKNPAIREAAGWALARAETGDFTALRRLLRGSDRRIQVQAADRVLELTR